MLAAKRKLSRELWGREKRERHTLLAGTLRGPT